MATVPQSTLRYLYYDVLKVLPYRDPNRTYSDLVSTLTEYPTLTLKGTKEYIFENGSPELLVYLGGVLPVSFRGTLYHFPILIWVPNSYPYESPILYVDPTGDIAVNPGQHVAPDGRIYHSYLAHWRDSWERSNIVDFLAILSDVFAKEPPVRSRPRQSNSQPPLNQPTPPPRPPLPHEAQPRQSPAPSSQRGPNAPPPPPPKEPANGDARPPSAQPKPSRYDRPPPLPTEQRRPLSMYQQGPGSGPAPPPSANSPYAPQRASSLRQSHPAQQWQQPPAHPPQQQAYPQYQGQPPTGQPPPPAHQYQSPQPASNPTPHPQQPQPHFQQPPQHQQPQQPQAQPTPKPPAPSLLDSPFDIPLPTHPTSSTNLPAPPIPRNPEKDALLTHLSGTLTSTLHTLLSSNASKLPPLQSQHSALTSTLQTLHTELANLTHLSTILTSNISSLQSSLSSADATILDARARSARNDIPAVDSMLTAPHIVSAQLYTTVAEERGIESALFCLQDAFTRGRVAPDTWSRKSRELARDEFRRKWLARKIARGMGLDVGGAAA